MAESELNIFIFINILSILDIFTNNKPANSIIIPFVKLLCWRGGFYKDGLYSYSYRNYMFSV